MPAALQEVIELFHIHVHDGLRYAVGSEVVLECVGISNRAISHRPAAALRLDVGEVGARGLVAYLDVDLFLHVGIVGDLVVLALSEPDFFEQVAREDMVDVAKMVHQLAHRDVLGKEAGVVGANLSGHEHPEVGAAGAGGFQLLHQAHLPECW